MSQVHPPRTSIDRPALMQLFADRRSMGLARLDENQPVPRELIEMMLEAANWAPSHGDTEPWRFVVFAGEGRAKLADIFAAAHGEDESEEGARKRAWAGACWIAIVMQPKLREDGAFVKPRDEEMMAVACAVQNMHLVASSQGLAGMWHSKGLSVHPEVLRGLGFEPPAELLGFFQCGWPNCDWFEGERGPWRDKVNWFDSV